jgi:hypothetical protein
MHNFGKIKNTFNNLIVEGIFKKDDKSRKIFKKYLKTIKESEVLKTQFLIYNNIENKIDKDQFSASLYVNENIKLLESFDKKKIISENNKLLKLLGDSKLESDYDLNALHESISNLIFLNRTAKNIDKITSEIKNVSNFILSNKEKQISENTYIPNSMLTNILIQNFNEKYKSIDEIEKLFLNNLVDGNFESRKEVYIKLTEDCINLIEKKLNENTTDNVEKFEKVKTKLSEDINKLNNDNLIEKLSKIIELKNNLEIN